MSEEIRNPHSLTIELAEKGDAMMQYWLYCYYHEGEGKWFEQDEAKAQEWLAKSAENDYAPAMVERGWHFLDYNDEENYPKAFKYFSRAAEHYNNLTAHYYLGCCYKLGIGTEVNPKLAFEWFKKAAKRKDALSVYQLGLCYLEGFGTKQNLQWAGNAFIKAGFLGKYSKPELDRCIELGFVEKKLVKETDREEVLEDNLSKEENDRLYRLCSDGKSIIWNISENKNMEEGFALIKESADGGYGDAQSWAGRCLHEGIGTEVDHDAAFDYHMIGAKKGFEYSQYLLGWSYYHGEGVEKNIDEAIYWLSKSANKDTAAAILLLAHCYNNGEGVKQDKKEAFKLFRKASKAGLSPAHIYVADAHFNGIGTSQNYDLAFKSYWKAARLDYPAAMLAVARCLKHGWGTEVDEEKAKKWFEKAMKADFSVAKQYVGEFS